MSIKDGILLKIKERRITLKELSRDLKMTMPPGNPIQNL